MQSIFQEIWIPALHVRPCVRKVFFSSEGSTAYLLSSWLKFSSSSDESCKVAAEEGLGVPEASVAWAAEEAMEEVSEVGLVMQVANIRWNQDRENWYITSMLASSASTKYSTAPRRATCQKFSECQQPGCREEEHHSHQCQPCHSTAELVVYASIPFLLVCLMGSAVYL